MLGETPDGQRATGSILACIVVRRHRSRAPLIRLVGFVAAPAMASFAADAGSFAALGGE